MRSGGSGQHCLRNSAGDDAISNRLTTCLTVGRGNRFKDGFQPCADQGRIGQWPKGGNPPRSLIA